MAISFYYYHVEETPMSGARGQSMLFP
jgi:hypothetical protein